MNKSPNSRKLYLVFIPFLSTQLALKVAAQTTGIQECGIRLKVRPAHHILKGTTPAPTQTRPSSPQLTPFLGWAKGWAQSAAAHSLPGEPLLFRFFSSCRSWEERTGCFPHEKPWSTALRVRVPRHTTHRCLLLSCMFALWAMDMMIRLITSV